MAEYVTIERGLGPDGRIAVVRFDRGDGINALSPEAMRQLTNAARSFEDDASTSVVVLTGGAKSFTAGFDLRDPEGRSRKTMDLGELRRHLKLGPRLTRAWQDMEQITIGAIEGFCIGGGVALAVALDFRVMARNGHLRVPEIGLGMNMSWQSVPRMLHLIGPVSWTDDRGWVSSQYLQYLYRNRYVYLPDYVDEIDVPIVSFALASYWSSHYAGRPWYHRRAHWSSYWQSHERFATRLTINPSAARIGRAAAARDAARPDARARVGVEERSRARVEERTRAGVTERTRAGVTERVTREKDIATRSAREGRERAAVQARMTRENARAAVREQPMDRARARTQTPPIMARGHDEPRAAAPRIERAQPNAARGGGPPANARAQMPAPAAPRAATPAMPQGGGAPHINAAPRGGGGPGGGGGHGQDKR